MLTISTTDTAVVVTDPQNDVLTQGGAGYGKMKAVIEQNDTVQNLETLFRTCKSCGFQLFVSPHALYPLDNTWIGKSVEESMLISGRFYQKENNDTPPSFGADYAVLCRIEYNISLWADVKKK